MSTDWEVKRKLYLWIKIRFYRSGGEIYRIWLRPLIIDVSIETTSFSIEIISWPGRRAHSWAQWPSKVRDSNARDFISQLSIQVQDFWKIDPCGYPWVPHKFVRSTPFHQFYTLVLQKSVSSTEIRQAIVGNWRICVEQRCESERMCWTDVLKWRISGAEKEWPWWN